MRFRREGLSGVALGGDLHGNCRCLHTSSESADNTANNQVRNTVRRSLKNSTDGNKGHSSPDGPSATQLICRKEVDYPTYQPLPSQNRID